jgi:internalin A
MKTSTRQFWQVRLLALALLLTPVLHAWPQTVAIPDPELQLAIREALGKPSGDITVEDMERLIQLDASYHARAGRTPILSLQGLEAAKNLTFLDLAGRFQPLSPAIVLTDFTPLAGLSSLTTLNLRNNQLTTLTLPAGLSSLTYLYLSSNQLRSLALPASLSSLSTLELTGNQLTNLTLPAGLTNLTALSLYYNHLTTLTLPAGLSSLTYLYLSGNSLTNLTLPAGLPNLTTLDLTGNQLTNLTLPAGLTNLTALSLYNNHLTNLTLPADLSSLTYLDLTGNRLTNLTLPAGLSSLTYVYLSGNPLASIALPAGILVLDPSYAYLKGTGVDVTLFPVLKSSRLRESIGFTFELFADVGTFTVIRSTNLKSWDEVGSILVTTPNYPGTLFTDATAPDKDKGFYQVRK